MRIPYLARLSNLLFMKQPLLFLVLFISFNSSGQSSFEIRIKDSATRLEIPFYYGTISKKAQVADQDGKLKLDFIPDSIEISAMGYHAKTFYKNQWKFDNIFYLNPRITTLKPAIIKPINPRDLIQQSFQRSDINHLPYQSFYQRAFMREAYYESNHLMKIAENGVRIYQYRKSSDEISRPYYKYGSISLFESSRHTNDSITYHKIVDVVGKKWSKPLFTRFNAIGYVKGMNLLNMIYTYCLEKDKDREIIYKGIMDYDGYKAYYIELHENKKGNIFQISKLYLHFESLAVLAFEVNATDGLDKVNLLGLKERILAWLFGVKFKIHKYYVRIQFKKHKDKFLLDDAVYFLPIEFERYKKKLIGYTTMQYKVDPNCVENAFPEKGAVVEMNKKFRGVHTYEYKNLFWKNYPYFPITKDQLQIIEETKNRNAAFLKRDK